MGNRKTGNAFETEFCERLFNKGFWVHNLTQNNAGQPADVIAVKNDKAFLIDCKVCEKNSFALSRVEPNQHTAMTCWKNSGNGSGWFALRLNDGSIYMFDYDLILAFCTSFSAINEDNILFYGQAFERWAERW